jgi:hypothetical protein
LSTGLGKAFGRPTKFVPVETPVPVTDAVTMTRRDFEQIRNALAAAQVILEDVEKGS